jgi:hypothetical protein
MVRAPSTFRQNDVTKAVKGVQAAGGKVSRVLIGQDGKIEIITGPAKPESADDTAIETADELRKLL